ncbi:hypothetical protein ACHAPU_002931 [Fusarium lateritium]
MVKALVLWDTVSSLHFIPHSKYLDLVSTTLPENLEYAYHALALDEKRGLFPPDIWKGETPPSVKEIKQCWFRGTHSHVGGSHKHRNGHYDNVSLAWMVAQLVEHDIISFDEEQLKRVVASDGTDAEEWQLRQHRELPDRFFYVYLQTHMICSNGPEADLDSYPAGLVDSNSKSWQVVAWLIQERRGNRKQDEDIAKCVHQTAVDQPGQPLGLTIDPMKDLEHRAMGWPGGYLQSDENDLGPEEGFGRLLITQRRIFDLERPFTSGAGYELLIRDPRRCNVFYPVKPQDDAEGLVLDIGGSTSLSADLSSTASTMPMMAPTSIENNSQMAAMARESDYSKYGAIDRSTENCQAYGDEYAASSASGHQPNYSLSPTAGPGGSAYGTNYSDMPSVPPSTSYWTDFSSSRDTEAYDGNNGSGYQRFANDVNSYGTADSGSQSQVVYGSRYASTSATSEQPSYRDSETSQVHSQDRRDYDREDRAERRRRSKGKSSRRRR